MTKFPDVFGTTQEYRNKVLKKGYIDIQKIRPKDVVDVEDDRQWLPDFTQVFAIINIAGTQSDYDSILLMANQRLVKCRLSPNQLVKRLDRQFLLHPKNDVGNVAKSIGITRHVPYCCGDFLLVPVGSKAASNNSWVRLSTGGELWEHDGKKSLVNYPTTGVLRIPHGKGAIAGRRSKCFQILAYYFYVALAILTTIELDLGEISVKKLRKISQGKDDHFREGILRELLE